MKVYVVTSEENMDYVVYETVKASAEEAEKYIRSKFPNVRKDKTYGNVTSYICEEYGFYLLRMYIHEETII